VSLATPWVGFGTTTLGESRARFLPAAAPNLTAAGTNRYTARLDDVRETPVMTPERFRECLHALAMSDGQLVRTLDVDDRLVRRWKSGERDVPPDVERWIEALVQHWQSNPPPIMRGRLREKMQNTY
jgi:DNA-binding transcriptional regulator YiaG